MNQMHNLPHCTGFANAAARNQHFQDHSNPNTYPNAAAYEQAGIDFMNLSVDAYNASRHPEGVYPWTRHNGDFAVIYWPPDKRGLFGVMSNAGVLRTFFGITTEKEYTQLYLSEQ